MFKYLLSSRPGKVLLVATVAFLSVIAVSTIQNASQLSTDMTSPFSDVSETSDHATAIKYLKDEGIFSGNADGSFKPESTLNRAEWAATLSRLAGTEPSAENYNNCFPDVKDEWFAPYVCLAKDQGWVKGYSSGESAGLYVPGNPVQDIEILVTLARLTNWDIEDSEVWYKPALDYALAHNIYEESSPVRDITREKMADVIFRTIATVFLGNDNYSKDLDDDIVANKLYDVVDVGLTNYTDDFIVPKISVKSDDGQVELIFREKDIPEGVSESDISIKTVDLEDASEGVRAFYSFEPTGLVFNNPVTISIISDYDPDSTPMLFHVVNQGLEPAHDSEISINKEGDTQTVTANIDSFSNYVLLDGIFGVSSVDPGVRRVGEIFFEPINVSYPNTRDIIFSAKSPGGTKDVFTWKMRLDKQFVSGIWRASLVYHPFSVIDSPPLTKMSGGSFTHRQEFKCVSPGDGFIEPNVLIQYYYYLLDENDQPGPLFSDFPSIKLWLTGKCVMPSAENLNVETQCGGSVTITGNLDKYRIETEKVKVFIQKAGADGAFVSFDDASYAITGGKFAYTAELVPGRYEYGVSALMLGAYTTFPVSERYEFEILPCPDAYIDPVWDDDGTPLIDDTTPIDDSTNNIDGTPLIDDSTNNNDNTPPTDSNIGCEDSCSIPAQYGFPVCNPGSLPTSCQPTDDRPGWDCYTFEDTNCEPSTRCFCIAPPEYL